MSKRDQNDQLKAGELPMDPTEGTKRIAAPSETKAESSGPFAWLSTDDIFSELPETKWVVPGLQVGPGRPSMIAAYGSTGKTLALQSIALSAAAGVPVWGHFEVPDAFNVRHIDYDQGCTASRRRYQRLAHGMGIGPEAIEGRLSLSVFPSVYLNSADAEEHYLREFEGVDLAVIDALRGAVPGVDENDSKIRSNIDLLSKVSERHGTAFILLHHAAKPKDGQTAATAARGSSAIFDACGSVFSMVGEQGTDKKVMHTKPSAESTGGALPPFFLGIEDVSGPNSLYEGIRVVYKKAADKPDKQAQKETDLEEGMYQAIVNNPGLSKRKLTDVVNHDTGLVGRLVDSLETQGRIENRGSAARPAYHAALSEQPTSVLFSP